MRILGITIPAEKRLEIGLTVLFGVGRQTAQTTLKKLGIDPGKKPGDLSMDEENAVRREIEAMKIEGNLKREITSNVKRLKDIKSYRGNRHMRKLPTKGQRTKTNSRTLRGNVRVTMGSGRRKVEKT